MAELSGRPSSQAACSHRGRVSADDHPVCARDTHARAGRSPVFRALRFRRRPGTAGDLSARARDAAAPADLCNAGVCVAADGAHTPHEQHREPGRAASRATARHRRLRAGLPAHRRRSGLRHGYRDPPRGPGAPGARPAASCRAGPTPRIDPQAARRVRQRRRKMPPCSPSCRCRCAPPGTMRACRATTTRST